MVSSSPSPKQAVKTDPNASSSQDENCSAQSVEKVAFSCPLITWRTSIVSQHSHRVQLQFQHLQFR